MGKLLFHLALSSLLVQTFAVGGRKQALRGDSFDLQINDNSIYAPIDANDRELLPFRSNSRSRRGPRLRSKRGTKRFYTKNVFAKSKKSGGFHISPFDGDMLWWPFAFPAIIPFFYPAFTSSRCTCRGGVLGGRGEGDLCDCLCFCEDIDTELIPVMLNLTETYDPGPDIVNQADPTCGCVNSSPLSSAPTPSPTALNIKPLAEDDTYILIKDSENPNFLFNALDNDLDANGDSLSVSSWSTIPKEQGSVVLNPNGSFTYIPQSSFVGTVKFEYVVEDGKGGADTANVAIIVNEAPEPAPDLTVMSGIEVLLTTNQNTPLSFDAIPHGSGVDDNISVTDFRNPENGVVVQSDGTFTYVPDNNFLGNDSFEYQYVGDSGIITSQTVSFVVNSLPVAENDAFVTLVNTPITFTTDEILENDQDTTGNILSVIGFVQPFNGNLVRNVDGSFTYTPKNAFVGVDSFTYTVSDEEGGFAIATVMIVVNSIPIAKDANMVTQVGESLRFGVDDLGEDTADDTLTIVSFTEPENGIVTMNPDGSLTYTPKPGFSGVESFDFTLEDGNGGTDTGTVTFVVNRPPTTTEGTLEFSQNPPVILLPDNILSFGTDPDGDMIDIQSFSQPENGQLLLNADGTLTYIPNDGYTGPDTFWYTIHDGNGGVDSNIITITFNPNKPPIAGVTTLEFNQNAPLMISPDDIISNGSDPDGDSLTLKTFSQPENGQLLITGDGSLMYIPNNPTSGMDTFTYTISDGNGGVATGTLTLIYNTNRPPVAEDSILASNQNPPFAINPDDILSNASDPDGDVLTLESVSQPENGQLFPDTSGTLLYVPNSGNTGFDTFDYTVNDGNGGVATGIMTITFGVNTPPVAKDLNLEFTESPPVIISSDDIISNGSDPDGDTLTLSSVTQPEHGRLFPNSDGSFTYLPNTGYDGIDTFTYTIDDGKGGLATATVIITFNIPALALKSEVTTNIDTTIRISLATILGNNFNAFTIISFTTPSNGVVGQESDGTFSYTPNDGFVGVDMFTVVFNDSKGITGTATVTITVNTPPDPEDDSFFIKENTSFTIYPSMILVNDKDADGDTLMIESVTLPTHGTLELNADGTYTFTPPPQFIGIAGFLYDVSDLKGGLDTAFVGLYVDNKFASEDGTFNASQDKPMVITPDDILDNDEGALTIVSFTQPTNGGEVSQNPLDGSLTFFPGCCFLGVEGFDVTTVNGLGALTTTGIEVNVGGPLDARNDLYPTGVDVVLNIAIPGILSNDIGDNRIVDQYFQPNQGAVSVAPNGSFTYFPKPGWSGVDSFFYSVVDSFGNRDIAKVFIIVGFYFRAPTPSASPSISAPPSISAAPSSSPSNSAKPTSSEAPSLSPTISVRPSSSAAPTKRGLQENSNCRRYSTDSEGQAFLVIDCGSYGTTNPGGLNADISLRVPELTYFFEDGSGITTEQP